jgi:hypothetical protein
MSCVTLDQLLHRFLVISDIRIEEFVHGHDGDFLLLVLFTCLIIHFRLTHRRSSFGFGYLFQAASRPLAADLLDQFSLFSLLSGVS